MIELKVPGKLFIIGEYSILKPGNEAVLVAIDRFINVTIKESNTFEFSSELGRFKWMLSDGLPVLMYDQLTHAKAAIYVAHQYLNLKNIKPITYSIKIDSNLSNHENQKYGLGSSGAVIIAVLKSVFKFHNIKISNLDLFKLSVLSQIEISDITSGGELAASIYGGWVHYQRYDLIWVLNNKGKLDDLLKYNWPQLEINKLDKISFKLAVCFSGMSQETKKQTDKLKVINQTPWYATFLNKTHLITTQFKEAIIRNDYYTAKHMIKLFRNELLELETQANIIIESEPFKKMIEIGDSLNLPTKVSGSGFGDCGFSIVNTEEEKNKIIEAWEKAGLQPLKISVWEHNE